MARMVAVLGGGVGGLAVARELRTRLDARDRVVLVERSPRHVFSPSLLWLMVGRREARQIARDLSWLPRRGIELRQAEVRAIDPEGKAVETDAGALAVDALVVILGLERTLSGVPGAAEAAYEFYSLEGAERLRRALAGFEGGRVAVAVLGTPYSCPAAPYEAALLMEEFLRRRGVPCELAIYTAEPYPMPTAGPAVGMALRELLDARGIRFHPQVRVREVRGRSLVFADGGEAPFDLLVAVPLHRAPEAVLASPLAGETGLVPVEPRSLATPFPGVWALGDVAALPLPGRHRPDVPLALPKAGVFAHRQAGVVAAGVAAFLAGRAYQGSRSGAEEPLPVGSPGARLPGEAGFDGVGFCFVETGEGRAGFGVGRFLAEPQPEVRLFPPARKWHWGKELFERAWLAWAGGSRAGEALTGILSAWPERYLVGAS